MAFTTSTAPATNPHVGLTQRRQYPYRLSFSTSFKTLPAMLIYALMLCLCVLTPSVSAATETITLDLPPRLQWDGNFGYCGEVSMIVAGLSLGQYCSQYKARSFVSTSQSSSSSQLLVGVNAGKVANSMHLAYTEWTTQPAATSSFLLWVKQQVVLKRTVIIGIFMNQYLFYGSTNTNAGDGEYDHIVPVTGITTTDRVNYVSTDKLFYSDNGLWRVTGKPPPYAFNATFSSFALSRSAANAKTAPIYSLNSNKYNYGISITGVKDTNGNTVPVRLVTSVNSEIPAIVDGSNTAPTAFKLNITATVSIPDQSVAYKLYYYTSFTNVPDTQFNANFAKAAMSWPIAANSGATFVTKMEIMSNAVAVFRAVRASAP